MKYLYNISPESAYIRENVYIPKRNINSKMLQESLTFDNGKDSILLYKDLKDHVMIPKYFISRETLQKRFNIIDKTPTEFKKVKIKSSINFRNTLQEEAAQAIKDSSGVLILPCGTGKTVISINEICQRRVPTVIVVNTEQIMNQWMKAIENFTNFKNIGIIRQNKLELEADIVIASIQTLSKRRDKISDKDRKRFGLVIFDEVDETATLHYANTADIFMGDRLGLTATEKRRDGMHPIFRYHMGPILYRDETFLMKPKIHYVYSFSKLLPKQYMYRNKTNYGRLFTEITKEEERNNLIEKLIKTKLEEGRKMLVLGERIDQLKYFNKVFKDSGLCIHEVDVEKRLKYLKEKKAVFAIRRLSKRALDQVDLDTLIIIHPMTDEGGIRQAIGRICREHKDKKEPEVYVIYDINVPPMEEMCGKMYKKLSDWDFEQVSVKL